SSFLPDTLLLLPQRHRAPSTALLAAVYLPSSPFPAETSRVGAIFLLPRPDIPLPLPSPSAPTSTGELQPPPPASVPAFFRRRSTRAGEFSSSPTHFPSSISFFFSFSISCECRFGWVKWGPEIGLFG